MDKFADIRLLVFEGCLKETIKFRDFSVVIRTLGPAEENFVIEMYQCLPKEYNLLSAVDTLQYAVYSINGCCISDEFRALIRDWPKQIIIKLFEEYLKLVERSRQAFSLIEEFITTDESKLRWSVVRSTKTNLNSAVITGNPNFEKRGLTQIQQLWVYLHQQEDAVAKNKLDWTRVEYMTDSICSFINPKAMRQVQNQKKLQQEEEMKRQHREEMKQIQNKSEEKVMIDNTADDLFDAIKKRPNEPAHVYAERVQKSVMNTLKEDDHDRLIREYEEFEFYRRLRIKKENVRRSRILQEKRMSKAIVIDLPEAPKGIQVGFQQVATLGDDVNFEERIAEQEKGNKWFVNGVDYSEVMLVTSFSMLKNRDKIFEEVTNESDEETQRWINIYIEADKEKSEVEQRIKDAWNGSSSDSLLDKRERVLSGETVNSFEDRQQAMKQKIQKQNELDEIRFGG